ncbi:IMV membrane protein [Nile crocodilepox virus]|uniref:IMV membrane protein n=1 Tax=Nile crocodilepox virus (isolate Crocodylus niloticus/Zimbabwe/Ume/2001) TaxID=1289473 RepID=Q070I3_CPRVZ|nr:IMV membrane protein [Nile crocodilepox virus]ABJ08959.1 IMV membrane protein [Nile crocodilepox virus]
MATVSEVFSVIGLTLLMLIMAFAGLILIVRLFKPLYRALMLNYGTTSRVLRVLELVGNLLVLPGSVVLYAAYVRKLKGN